MFTKPDNSNIQKGNIPSINNSNNNMAKDDKYQHEINELKRKNKIAERTKLQQQKNRNVSKQHKFGIKKQEHGLCVSWGLTRKSRTNHCHQLHRTNHENFVKLQRTIENNTRIQFGSAGQ